MTITDEDVQRMTRALLVTEWADCTRRRVGAVLVLDGKTIAAGANSLPWSLTGCASGGCPRGAANSVDPYTPYDQPGSGYCPAVHAEARALLTAGLEAGGATCYVTAEPCGSCLALLAGADVSRVVFRRGDDHQLAEYDPIEEVARRIQESMGLPGREDSEPSPEEDIHV